AGVTVDPPTLTMNAIGQTVTVKPTARDDHGNIVTHPTFIWKSDHPDVVSVSNSGELRAARAGHALVSATSDPVSGVVDVTVAPGAVIAPPKPTPTAPAPGTPAPTPTPAVAPGSAPAP